MRSTTNMMTSHARLLVCGLAFAAGMVACAVAAPDNIPMCSATTTGAPGLPYSGGGTDGCKYASVQDLGSTGSLQECYGKAEQWAADDDLTVAGNLAYVTRSNNDGRCYFGLNPSWTDTINVSTVSGSCNLRNYPYSTCVVDVSPDNNGDNNDGGAVTGDPHFVGFNGAKYDYHGVPGATFNLISTEQTQVNALLGPDYVNGLTYITAVGVSTETTHVKIAVIQGKMRVSVDDVEVHPTDNDTLKFKDVDIILKEMTAEIESPDIRIALSMHKDLFLDLEYVKLLHAVQNIHGVLGQTAALSADATTTYVGADSEYYVSDLWAADFKHNKFIADGAPLVNDIPRKTVALTNENVHVPNTAAVVNNAE